MLEIWIIDVATPLRKKQFCELYMEIDTQKQARIKNYYYHDALRSIIGDIAVRLLIYKHCNELDKKIIFEYNKYGKPYLGAYDDISFNISHSGNYVTCAISSNSIGIDVETIKPIELSIARKMFANSENDYISSASTMDEKYRRFYSIWTQKEAYVKYIGKGLYLPMKTFDTMKLQREICFQCIFQTSNAICHICQNKMELPIIQYISAIELYYMYKDRIVDMK